MMIHRKKTLIVEPSGIITEGLIKILDASNRFELLSPIYSSENLPTRLAAGKPDVLIINPTLLSPVKPPAIVGLLKDYPATAAVALVYQYIEPQILRPYHGTIDIRDDRQRIVDLLLECCASAKNAEPAGDANYELTSRETDVLIFVAKGFMNREIAERLNISIHTVISHRKNITRKTNIKSVAGLAMYALMNNLIEES